MKLRSLVTLMSLLTFLGLVARAEPLKIGADAPAVSGVTDEGKTLNLADVYKANDYTLVWFYPKALTGGCTKQGCSLRDGWAEITKRSVAVYGVSVDTQSDQKAFKEKYHLPFTLLADKEKVVTKAFQAPSLSVAIGYAKRQAYLFEDGKCIMADYGAPTTEQADKVIKFLDGRKK